MTIINIPRWFHLILEKKFCANKTNGNLTRYIFAVFGR